MARARKAAGPKAGGGGRKRPPAGGTRPGRKAKTAAAPTPISFGRILRWSLLLQVPALVLAAWGLVRLDGGRPALRHAFHQGDLLNLGRIIGGAELVALTLAVLLPLAASLLREPMERFRQGRSGGGVLALLTSAPLGVAALLAVPVALAIGGYAGWMGLDGLGLEARIRGLFG